MRFRASYEVEDGYVGKSAPQYFYIDDSDIDEDMDEESLMEVFYETMQEDFQNKIYPIETCKEEYLDWCKRIIKCNLSD